GTDAAHAPQLVAQLEALLTRFENTPRKRSSIEAPQALTQAYVRYVFACGLARLGQADRARALATAAAGALDTQEPSTASSPGPTARAWPRRWRDSRRRRHCRPTSRRS
ncbi:hypothetical protein ACLESO_59040, partial [Pyxidicoccus sp. 3LG]